MNLGMQPFFQTKDAYRQTFEDYKRLRKQVVELQRNQQENKARIEMLEFQIAEIEAAALEVDEDLRLEQERQRLLNHKMIADTLTNAYTMLDAEEFSSLANVRSAMNDLESIEEYDPSYKELSSQLSETFYALEDITKRLEDVVDGLEFDGNRLMQVESRLDLIHSITRKYGGQVKDVLEYLAQITKEYSLLTGSDLSSEDLEKELKRLEKVWYPWLKI